MYLFVYQSIDCMLLFDQWMFEQLHQVGNDRIDDGIISFFSSEIAFRYALIIGKRKEFHSFSLFECF